MYDPNSQGNQGSKEDADTAATDDTSGTPTAATAEDKQEMENSTSVLSKILMGFTVIFLIGVLVRLIQLRTRRNALAGLVDTGMASMSSGLGGGIVIPGGGGCCNVSTTVAILFGGLVMLYILFAARKAKEQQRAENMTWNMVSGVVLVIGVLILMEFTLVQHHNLDWKPKEEAAVGIWAYFIIAIAALAAAKISNKIQYRLKENAKMSRRG